MSADQSSPKIAPAQAGTEAETPAETPGSIYVALLLFAFAVATPFIATFIAGHGNVRHDGWGELGLFVQWTLAGAVAAFVAIISTIIGARRGPRSGLTMLAIVLAGLGGLLFLFFLALAAH